MTGRTRSAARSLVSRFRRQRPLRAGSLLVSYARARGESLGVLCKEGLMQRAERLVLMILACLLDAAVVGATHHQRGRLVFWAMGLIAVGTFITAVHRTAWIAMRLRAQDRK